LLFLRTILGKQEGAMTYSALTDVDAFLPAGQAEPHAERARAILRQHPQVKRLLGPSAWTMVLTVALVVAQVSIALEIHRVPWWVMVLVAYTIGAVINCAVLNMIHEASHNLIFRSPRWNRFAAYVANLGAFSPYVETFYHYHLPHHHYLGHYDRDMTMASHWEARWVGRSVWRKAVWFLFFPLIYPFRVARSSLGKPKRHRLLLNAGIQLAWLGLLCHLGGWPAITYMVLSFYFHFGLHPLNAIALQEHFCVSHGEESYSYYGIGNWITFNAGYHVEHHDMPYVAWFRLPALKRIAPEFYKGRHGYRSWTGLILNFVFDRQWSLWARVERSNVSKEPKGVAHPASHQNIQHNQQETTRT
jgi:sphingolipid 4-desaturase/C4-monooxygenase